ncbi:glycosyltransferase family 4 protein [Serratia fonticola]
MEKIHIIQVARDATDSGSGRVVFETSRYFINEGYNVTLITDAKCNSEVNGMDIIYTPFGEVLKKWPANNKLTRTARHLTQIILFFILSGIKLNRIKGGKIVINHNIEGNCGDIYVMHNVFNYENKQKRGINKFFRWLNPVFFFRGIRELCFLGLSRGKTIISVSNQTLLEVTPYCSKKNKIVNINNGVNPSYYTYRERSLSAEKFNIIFVGHEFERKGLQYIIESLNYLPEFVQLYVVGGAGSSQRHYKTLAESYGILERIHFTGTLVGKELIEMYHRSDVFILPSSYETWALVGLESMSTGLPALMTKVGGIPEYLSDGYNGFFVERNGKDISEKVNLLLKNNDLYKKVSINARKTANEHSWEKGAKEYLRVINEVKKNRKC